MGYKLISTIHGEIIAHVDENEITSFIPADENNVDYQAYLASLEEPTV